VLRSEPFKIEDSVIPTQELRSIRGWDSMKHLTLLMECERVFGKSISQSVAVRIKTLDDLMKAFSE